MADEDEDEEEEVTRRPNARADPTPPLIVTLALALRLLFAAAEWGGRGIVDVAAAAVVVVVVREVDRWGATPAAVSARKASMIVSGAVRQEGTRCRVTARIDLGGTWFVILLLYCWKGRKYAL